MTRRRSSSHQAAIADDLAGLAANDVKDITQSKAANPPKKAKQVPKHDVPSDPRTVTTPFTKESWRYEYAEAVQFEGDVPVAYRPVRWMGPPIMSTGDRADQLTLSDDRMTVTGHKGYAMARATQGVGTGHWYFEVEVLLDGMEDISKHGNDANHRATVETPPSRASSSLLSSSEMANKSSSDLEAPVHQTLPKTKEPHWRIGWAQKHSTLQAPVGYDRFSYSWRDIKGTKFHNSRGSAYAEEGYKPGDVLGFEIYLPQKMTSKQLPIQHRTTHFAVSVGQKLFMAEKLKTGDYSDLEAVAGSKLICYKNGVCQGVMFENINSGIYYPAVSLYNKAMARMNFGPEFKYPPRSPLALESMLSQPQPLCDAYLQTYAAQTLSDTLAKVINATDVVAQKQKVVEFFTEHQKELALSSDHLATVASLKPRDVPPEPSLDASPSSRIPFQRFLRDQLVFVDEVNFDALPSRLRPKSTKNHTTRAAIKAKTATVASSNPPATSTDNNNT